MLGFGSANTNKIVFVLKTPTVAWIRQQLKQVNQDQNKHSNKRHADVVETSGELPEIRDTKKGESLPWRRAPKLVSHYKMVIPENVRVSNIIQTKIIFTF